MVKKLLSSALDDALSRRNQYRAVRTQPYLLEELISLFRPKDVGIDLIRLGGELDGGYLVPDDLEGIVGCFSPGVSLIADFESDLVNKYGIPCYLADASVEAPPSGGAEMDFEKKFLGVTDDASTTRLGSWVREKVGDSDGDLLLQMDIEGSEYEVLADAPAELLNRFRIIVLELHELDDLFSLGAFKYMKIILKKLVASHTVVHLHPNNFFPATTYHGFGIPPLMEVTLLRNDRFKTAKNQEKFPHPLDRKNVADKPDLPLPEGWYRRT